METFAVHKTRIFLTIRGDFRITEMMKDVNQCFLNPYTGNLGLGY